MSSLDDSSSSEFSSPSLPSLSSPLPPPTLCKLPHLSPHSPPHSDDATLLPYLLSHLSTLRSSGALAHLDLLSRQADSLTAHPSSNSPHCQQIHLGVVPIPAFQALMAIVNAVRQKLPPVEAGEGEAGGGKGDELQRQSTSAPVVGEGRHEQGMDISYVNGFMHSAGSMEGGEEAQPPLLHSPTYPPSVDESQHTAATTASSSPSSSPSSSSSSSSAPTSTPPAPPALDSAAPLPTPSTPAPVERDRFCKPSRLITAYSSKPFLMTPIHLERQYVTSRKNLDGLTTDERAELCTVTVRWMGRPLVDELYLVATDVCALINIRKSNTAKTVAQFSDAEKVSMPVHCSSGKGSSTHILTVLTMAGVRRLLTSSRSVLSSALLDYLNRITAHIHAYPHYVPVNDPTKPSVVPLFKPDATPALPPSTSAPLPSPSDPTPLPMTAVKAEAITPARAWESCSATPPQVLHARSLPTLPLPLPLLHAPSPASSPALTRTLSGAGRKQGRGKREPSHPTQQKRIKEEVRSPSPAPESVRLLMEEGSMGGAGAEGWKQEEEGGGGCYSGFHPHPHSLHHHSQSPPPSLPPPFYHPPFQAQSPTLSSASSPYFGAAPLVPSMTLSPTFGPLTSPSFPAVDYSGGGSGSHFYPPPPPLSSSPPPSFSPSTYFDPRQRRPASPQGRQAVYKYPPSGHQHNMQHAGMYAPTQYGGRVGGVRQYQQQQQQQQQHYGEGQGGASHALHANPHARSPHQSPHGHGRVLPSSAGGMHPSASAPHFAQ